ncbi:MAG: N-formylglutamate deformylase [Pseudomonadota bacterium]
MEPVEIINGTSPVVLGFPHTGTYLPEETYSRLTPLGQALGDTDWHIHRLYSGLLENATSVRATFHRYVIDANRDPSGKSLYPGKNTTGLVPIIDFDGEPLWLDPPTEAEIAANLADYHAVYHEALERELKRIRDIHGVVILYDCHSIRSNIPYLFDGTLPDFNIGTNDGYTCMPEVQHKVERICEQAEHYTTVTNGRFKGGWTTRHYGRPAEGFHAIQMELAQSTYLETEEPPFGYDDGKAENLRIHLKQMLRSLEAVALSQEQ